MEEMKCTICEAKISVVSSKIEIKDNILTRSQIGYCDKCGVRHDWQDTYSFIEQTITKVWNS